MSENFANQAIREISRVLMDFNFANQQNQFISWELILKKNFEPTLTTLMPENFASRKFRESGHSRNFACFDEI